MGLQPGEIIDGKYRIIRELGAGSMGAVFEGENVRIRRRVAIKILLPAVAERGDVVKRFEREAQAAGRIGSEHIVEVLDLGTMSDGGFYMVMEFLEGQTLGDRIRRSGRIPPRALVPVVQQLLFGLEMAHEARIIHRDLKPDNVFLVREHAGQQDFVKILDFGISKFNPLNAEEGMSMTRTGTVMGTPFYMAPEQAKGSKEIDGRSDLYSVGVILYEAVTGQRPFHAGTFNELIFKIVLETPPPPEHFVPDLDPAFSRIIRRAMARDPEQRYADASSFRDALSLWLHTGRSGDDKVTPPPGESDWDGTKATRVMDPPEAATYLFEAAGGGTALVPPEGLGAPSVPHAPHPPTAPIPVYAGAPPGAAMGMHHLGHQPLPANAPTPVGQRAPIFFDDPVASVAGVPRKRGILPFVIGGSVFLLLGAVTAVAFLLPGDSEADTSSRSQVRGNPVEVSDDEAGAEPGEDASETDDEAPAIVDLDEDEEAKPAPPPAGEETEEPPRVVKSPPPRPRPTPPSPKQAAPPPPPPTAKPQPGRRIQTEL